MSWSITIARVAGSEIRIHLTFLILLAWIGIAQYLAGGADAALDSVLFIVAVFACVALHELGHAAGLVDSYKVEARESLMYGYLP